MFHQYEEGQERRCTKISILQSSLFTSQRALHIILHHYIYAAHIIPHYIPYMPYYIKYSHIHTCGQYRICGSANLHVFGLWRENTVSIGRTCRSFCMWDNTANHWGHRGILKKCFFLLLKGIIIGLTALNKWKEDLCRFIYLCVTWQLPCRMNGCLFVRFEMTRA